MPRFPAILAALLPLAGCSSDESGPPSGDDSASPSGLPFLGITPKAVDLGLVDVGSAADAKVAIANVGVADLELQDVRLVKEDAALTIDWTGPTTLAVGEFVDVAVRWAPTTFADLASSLQISTNDVVRPLAEVSIVGATPDPDIDVTPAKWDFGAVDRGSAHVMGVSIANTGKAALTVTSLDYVTTDGDLTLDKTKTPFVVAPGESVDMRVRYTPTDDGPDEGTLTVDSDDPDEPVVTVQQTGSAIALPSCVVAEWRFEGDAHDGSGNGNDGTLYGVVPTSNRNGVADAAYGFDDGAYIDVPGSDSFDAIETGGQVTMAAWIWVDAWYGNTGFPVVERYREARDDGWTLYVHSVGIWFYSTTGEAYLIYGFDTEQWYFVAVSVDDAADEARFYVDGELVGTVSTAAGPSPTHNGDVVIGVSPSGGDEYAMGTIDDVYMFDCVLTDDEIADLYARK